MRDRYAGFNDDESPLARPLSSASCCRARSRQSPADAQERGRPHASKASPTSAASGKPTTKPTGICRRTPRCPRAVTQQGVYPYDYARVPAAPVARARRCGRGAGIARRRSGRRPDSVQAGSAGEEERERGALDRPRPGTQVLPAGHSAGDVHALSVPDHAEHEQDSHRFRILQYGAHDPSGQGRRPAGRHLDGPLGRTLGRRHARRRRRQLQRSQLVRSRRQLSTAMRCIWSNASH